MTIHELKTLPEYFQAVWERRKPFEVRKDDRRFQVGDGLRLREHTPDAAGYTGRWIFAKVTYVLHGGAFGVEPGHAVLGIQVLAAGGDGG